MKKLSIAYLLAALFAVTPLLDAQNTKEDVESQKEVVVTAERPGKGQEGSYQSLSFSEGAEARSARTVSEIIEKQAGLKVNRYGPPGTYSSLSIRGSNAEQVGIYLEGMPLNDASGGAVNIENLPLGLFDRAEIYRSYTPLHLPGSHLGGALDLMTAVKPGQNKFFVKSTAHTLQGGSLGLGYSGNSMLHYLEFSGSANRYKYDDDNGTPFFNTADDIELERKNEDTLQGGYTGIFFHDLGKSRLTVLADFLAKEQGLPGVIGNETEKVRYHTYRGLSKAALKTPLNENWLLQAHTYANIGYSRLQDNDFELAAGYKSQRRLNTQGGLGFSPTWYVLDSLTLQMISEARFTRLFLDEDILADRFELDGGLGAEFMPLTWLGRLQLNGKLNYVQDNPREVLNQNTFGRNLESRKQAQPAGQVRLGAFPLSIYKKLTGQTTSEKKDRLEVFATVSYAERFPSLTENYGDGGLLLPAPGLKKEEALTNAAGIQGLLPCKVVSCRIYAAYFLTAMNNLILFVANSQKTMIAINAGRAQIEGVEADFSLGYKHYLQLNVRYTYLNAIDKSRIPFYLNKYLPFRPRHTFTGMIETGSREIRFFSGADWQGANYRDRYNSYYLYLERRTRIFAGSTVYLGKQHNHEITFTVKNIFDQRQVDVIGYPLPGRVFELKYQATFSGQKREKP